MKSEAAIAVAKAAKAAISGLTSRPGGSTPGAIAMRIDSDVLATLAGRIRGSICITGTNGKTSTTNLVADAISAMESNVHGDDGIRIVSNRDGDNMDIGIVTAIASQTSRFMESIDDDMKPYAVLECDELFTKRVLPKLKPDALLLLNLFRDQLDRYGEIDRTQRAIEDALKSSPSTTLVYNADDPLCSMVAEVVSGTNECVPFSCMLERTDADLLDDSGSASDSRLCPNCGMPLDYSNVAYGQIGNYWCPSCDWKPAIPLQENMFRVVDVPAGDNGDAEEHRIFIGCAAGSGTNESYIKCPPDGLHMDYNIAAAACLVSTIAPTAFPSLAEHDEQIRRKAVHDAMSAAVSMQRRIGGRGGSWIVRRGDNEILVRTKLAKNPTGFNRMLKEATRQPSDALLLLLNDEDPDGHDVSWIWDVDIEGIGIESPIVMTGGERKHDMALRTIYAGYDPDAIDGGINGAIDECLKRLGTGATLTVIANYTSFCQTIRSLKAAGAEEISPSDEPLWADRTVIDDGLDGKVSDMLQAMINGDKPTNVAPEFAMAMRNAFIDPINGASGRHDSDNDETDTKQKADDDNACNQRQRNTNVPSENAKTAASCANNDTNDAESNEKNQTINAMTVELESVDGNVNAAIAADTTGGTPLPAGRRLKLTWLYPDAMNLYGDRGNAICLRRRIEAAGIECDYDEIRLGDEIDLTDTDICLIGGGSDRDQKTVMRDVTKPYNAGAIKRYIDNGGVMLAICGGYQMLGDSYVDAEGEKQDGLGIIKGMTTIASPDGFRLIGNTAVALTAMLGGYDGCDAIGFENHGGRTQLPQDGNIAKPLGKSLTGTGNNGNDGMEGVRYINAIGTYLHGCLLPKNPAIADWLIGKAYEKRYGKRIRIEWDDSPKLRQEETAARADAMKLIKRAR